jgi:hypothetical protein
MTASFANPYDREFSRPSEEEVAERAARMHAYLRQYWKTDELGPHATGKDGAFARAMGHDSCE